jgi:uncharacterized protein (TIGR02246 family)
MNATKVFIALTALTAAMPAVARTAPGTLQRCHAVTPAIIASQFDRFSAAWAARDPDTVTALFTVEPVLLPTLSNQPRTTPAAVRDYFITFLKNKPSAHIDTSTIEIDCHTASRLGTWTVTLTDPTTGTVRDVKARYSFIYRYEGNDWKIDHLHSSVMPQASAADAQH